MTQGISSSLNLTLARLNSIENNFAALENISARLNGVQQNYAENKDFQTILNEKIKEVKNTNKGNLGFDYQVKVDEETNVTYVEKINEQTSMF